MATTRYMKTAPQLGDTHPSFGKVVMVTREYSDQLSMLNRTLLGTQLTATEYAVAMCQEELPELTKQQAEKAFGGNYSLNLVRFED